MPSLILKHHTDKYEKIQKLRQDIKSGRLHHEPQGTNNTLKNWAS